MTVSSSAKSAETFFESYEQNLQENRTRLSFFLELIEDFKILGIPVLPLKGLDLLIRAYPSAGLRPMADIDLLIQKKDIRKVMNFFEEKGFQRRPDEGLTYLSPDKSLNFDIIWDFWYFFRPGESDALWAGTVAATFREIPVRLLHPEDDFIYLTAYVTLHRGVLSETFVRDLEFFLEKESSAIDWDRLARKIRSLKLRTPIFYGLAYAREKGCTQIQEDFLNGLHPASLREKILLSLMKTLVTEAPQPKVSYFFTWLGYPGFRGKLKLMRAKLFPAPWEAEIHWGTLSRPGYFSKILLRPFLLCFRSLVILTQDFLFFLSRHKK